MADGRQADVDALEPLIIKAARRKAEGDPLCHIRIACGVGTTVRGFLTEVDEWVAAAVEQARADAWDEGFTHARFRHDGELIGEPSDNPYRAALADPEAGGDRG